MYEDDLIFAVFLQTAFERDARLLSYFLSDELKMALESLAIQIFGATQSLIMEIG